MKRYLAVTFAAFTLSGCFEKGEQDEGLAKAVRAVEGIEVSKNSPDMTIKSWWRLKDAGAAMYFEECKKRMKVEAPYFAKISDLSMPDVYSGLECPSVPSTYDRQITKVEVQSETRAVLTARISNTTPPDQGALLSEEDKKRKEAGEAYQYVLERKDSGADWKISRISNMPSWSHEWQMLFKKPEPSSNRWVFEYLQ